MIASGDEAVAAATGPGHRLDPVGTPLYPGTVIVGELWIHNAG